MKKISLALLAGAMVTAPLARANEVNVVASFTVLADIVKNIGGEHVIVKSLVGPNGDPHTFEPTPQDSQALAMADVVFISGLGMEGWIDRLVSASGYTGTVSVASTGINTRSMEEEGRSVTDPHAWTSMHNGALYAKNVMDTLIKRDPPDADYFRQHGEAYIAKLNQLDSWAVKTFAEIPQSHRKVLTSHDAFGYFGQRYHVTFLAPLGFSTESEASASKMALLINQLKTEQIKTYFIENQTDPRLVRQIATETGARPGGELYPEALSEADGPAGSYIAAFQHNVILMAHSMK